MEKERKIKIISLCALLVAVLGLTVAFAALSQTLTINGSATVDTATWDVRFLTSKEGGVGSYACPSFETNGDGTVDENVTIDKTSITNVSLGVTKPNDVAIIRNLFVNAGTIDAKLVSYELPTLCTTSSPVESCDWDNDGTVSKSDVDKVNENISVVGFCKSLFSDAVFKSDDVIYSADSKNDDKGGRCSFGIVYGKVKDYEAFVDGMDESSFEESTELPSRSLKFSNLSFKVNFAQAD